MDGEQPGQDTPAIGEAQNLQPEQTQTTGTTDAQTDSAEGGKQESPAPEVKTFTQDDVNAIVQREKLKAERKAFREARDMLARQQAPQAPQQTANDDGKPRREQFASEDEWLDARDVWRDRQREMQTRQQRAEETARTIATKTEKLYAQAEKLPGFDRLAFDEALETPGLAPVTLRALVDSEVAPQLMAHFASNVGEVERIAKLSPERQAVELGKLEVKLQAAPKTTKAPPPVGTVNGAGSGTPNLESADLSTYMKLRAKQGAWWAPRQ